MLGEALPYSLEKLDIRCPSQECLKRLLIDPRRVRRHEQDCRTVIFRCQRHQLPVHWDVKSYNLLAKEQRFQEWYSKAFFQGQVQNEQGVGLERELFLLAQITGD